MQICSIGSPHIDDALRANKGLFIRNIQQIFLTPLCSEKLPTKELRYTAQDSAAWAKTVIMKPLRGQETNQRDWGEFILKVRKAYWE